MTDTPAHILLVDDEASIIEVMSFALGKEGYAVTFARTGEQAAELIEAGEFDLYVLDIMLPGIDGLELCRMIRDKTDAPVLFLSARDEEVDRVLGLKIGADDYLGKPFGIHELLARVHALLRRSRGSSAVFRNRLHAAGLTLDSDAHRVWGAQGDVTLTPREFELLQCLMRDAGHVVTREDLLKKAWGWDVLTETKTVDTHIKRLRRKIAQAGYDPQLIETVRGYGYRISADRPA